MYSPKTGFHHQTLIHIIIFNFLCRAGEGKAYWSLGNAYTSLGDYKQARHFSSKHLQLAAEIGDSNAVDVARENLTDLDNVLQLQDK